MNLQYRVNEGFFSTWSRSMAYVLGFIATDGCVTYEPGEKYELRIESADKEILEKIRACMGSNHPLHQYNREDLIQGEYHRSTTWTLSIRSKRLVSDVIHLGITPRKSLTLAYPNVPDEFQADFIRGVFDGDGSVYIARASTPWPVLKTKIVSASRSFIQQLSSILSKRLGVSSALYEENDRYYVIHLGSEDSLRLYDFLYHNATIYLDRKKRVFEQFFAVRGKNTNIVRCQRCGEEFERTGRGQKWCPKCKPIVQREQWKAKGERKKLKRRQKREMAAPKMMTCARCGQETERTNGRQKYCKMCQAAVRAEYARNRSRKTVTSN